MVEQPMDRPNRSPNIAEQIGQLTLEVQTLRSALESNTRERENLRHRLHIAEQFALQMAEKHGPKSVY